MLGCGKDDKKGPPSRQRPRRIARMRHTRAGRQALWRGRRRLVQSASWGRHRRSRETATRSSGSRAAILRTSLLHEPRTNRTRRHTTRDRPDQRRRLPSRLRRLRHRTAASRERPISGTRSSTAARTSTLPTSTKKVARERWCRSAEYQRPNQRARRLAPKSTFSATSASDGALKLPVGFGPERKSTSTRPTRPAPNSM